MPDPDKEIYERNKGVAASNYHVTELDTPTIDRPDPGFESDAKRIAGPVLDILDWVWTEFEVAGGKGFLDSIVEPVSGNPKSIAANGKAWQEVGKQFGELVGNMGSNAAKLASQHWEGEAADAFRDFLTTYWKDGAAWAGEQVGLILKKGFDKVAEACQSIADAIIRVIEQIVNLASRIAKKAIPIIGWAWSAIELFADAIGIDIDSLYNDIMNIKGLYDQITGLITQIEETVTHMGEYFKAFDQVIDAVKAIPEVGSLQDAADIRDDIAQGSAEMKEQRGNIEESVTEAEKTRGRIEETLNG